jgi:hypothetical protein
VKVRTQALAIAGDLDKYNNVNFCQGIIAAFEGVIRSHTRRQA